jgi:hypothetical protein
MSRLLPFVQNEPHALHLVLSSTKHGGRTLAHRWSCERLRPYPLPHGIDKV